MRRYRHEPRTGRAGFSAQLASANPDFFFHADLTLAWEEISPPPTHHDPQAVACDYVRGVAESVANKRPLNQAEIVEHRANTLLGVPCDLEDQAVRITWGHAQITADPADIADATAERRRQRESRLKAEEQDREIARIEAFRYRVLSDPGMALAHSFMNNPGSFDEGAITRIENLARKAAVYDPQNAWVAIAHILQEFISELSPDARTEMISALPWWFARYRKSEFTQRLRKEMELRNIPLHLDETEES
ncbi:hypothetical protein ACH427_29005 [Streptomyces sp. NPDC020379]|uniref:hypothetical protein n=1 Tax=Streptomyces sp. NPDC020379 TaxID=3365071 RepID=UPI0037B682E7